MKTIKRVKGFTMVELIVVMAILAVLCGVLIPNAIAWITDSKLKTCNSEAKTVFNTAVTVVQDYQIQGTVKTGIADVYGETNPNFTRTIEKKDNNDVTNKITNKLGTNFSENSYWAIQVAVTNADNKNRNTIKVNSALYGDNNTSSYIGRYPIPATKSYSGGIATALSDSTSNIFNIVKTQSDAIYTP